jgi:hypothetical protein
VHHRQQVPPFIQEIADITDDMPIATIVSRQQVARPNIMAESFKGPTNNAGRFAPDQNLERLCDFEMCFLKGNRHAASLSAEAAASCG